MLNDIIFGAILPAIVTATILLIAPHNDDRPHHPWTGAAALGAAVVVAFLGLVGWPGIVPDERWHRLFHLTILTTAIGVVSGRLDHRQRWARPVVATVVAVTAGLVLQRPGSFEHELLHPALLGVFALLLACGLPPIGEERRSPVLSSAVLLAFAGAAVILLQTRNARLTLLAAAGAAGAAASIAVGLISRRRGFLDRTAATVAAALLPGLVFTGAWYDYGAVPTIAFVLICLAPLVARIGQLPPFRKRRVRGAVLAIGAVAAVAALAVTIAMVSGEADPYG